MKAIIQKVKYSSVKSDIGFEEIDKGLNVLIGFEKGDSEEKIEKMAKKIVTLKIFDNFKKSILDINGEILLIPNFTIPAVTKKTRPSFHRTMEFDKAKEFFGKMINELNTFVKTKGGVFGADMEVTIINDGPVSFILEV